MFDEFCDTTARHSPDQLPSEGEEIAVAVLARLPVGATPLPAYGPEQRPYRPS